MGKRFLASYPGTCGHCGDDIDEGNEVGYNEDDELCHGDCLDDLEADEVAGVDGWAQFMEDR